jgi:hypothetical protein
MCKEHVRSIEHDQLTMRAVTEHSASLTRCTIAILSRSEIWVNGRETVGMVHGRPGRAEESPGWRGPIGPPVSGCRVSCRVALSPHLCHAPRAASHGTEGRMSARPSSQPRGTEAAGRARPRTGDRARPDAARASARAGRRRGARAAPSRASSESLRPVVGAAPREVFAPRGDRAHLELLQVLNQAGCVAPRGDRLPDRRVAWPRGRLGRRRPRGL